MNPRLKNSIIILFVIFASVGGYYLFDYYRVSSGTTQTIVFLQDQSQNGVLITSYENIISRDVCQSITINNQRFFNEGCEGKIEDPEAKEVFDTVDNLTNMDIIEAIYQNDQLIAAKFSVSNFFVLESVEYYYLKDQSHCKNELFDCTQKNYIKDSYYRD
jgi:hypothetical protein